MLGLQKCFALEEIKSLKTAYLIRFCCEGKVKSVVVCGEDNSRLKKKKTQGWFNQYQAKTKQALEGILPVAVQPGKQLGRDKKWKSKR